MTERRPEPLRDKTRYDPAEVERRIFAEWLEGGYFHPAARGSAAENYSVAIPPPNITGALHMGHALNGSIQDTLVRMNRMRGRNTLWLLGTDHAGIATQSVVEKELRAEGKTRQELGRGAFLERVWAWKEEYGSRIVAQYQRLGASCDYERERFTLDEGYVRAVYRAFKCLHEKGYIYRDNYIVNWDPGSHSAISDLEVENREVEDTLYWIDYPLEGSERVLTVATVRPETMLADTAVAVNPDDRRYSDLVGGHCVLPLVGRRLPIIADRHVDPEFGTGALKITPGHDPNDFEIGRRHGLEEIVAIGPDGRMSERAGRFAGLSVAAAQAAVLDALREEGSLRAEQPHLHSVPYSHRSGERIEPLISLQWFCRMDELAKPAIAAVEGDEVRIAPPRWKRVYLDWMAEIRPWCISRQLWWGHRIPVWYCDACEETVVAEAPPQGCGVCGGPLRQEEDVLDTWFSSALWPFATLGWPQDTAELRAFYPTSFLTTAREILFLWVARMIMMGLEFPGRIPFADVYVHSVIQARDGRRMSKSLGTGIDPLEEIEIHGADALRFGLLAMSSTQDVRYSDAKVQQGADLANKAWNAGRLILLNAAAVAAEPQPVRLEDRWILSRLERTIASVTALLGSYDFSRAVGEAYSFFWSELCDWYLEIVKPRLYEAEPEVSATLLWMLERVLCLLHPIMPFVTEEIWAHHPARRGHLAVHPFPVAEESLLDPGAEAEVETAIELTRRLRAWRELAQVPVAGVLAARIEGAAPQEFVGRLARFRFGEEGGDAVASIGPVRVLAALELDAAGLAGRLQRRREELRSELGRAELKLANEGFIAKAPAEIVEAERRKLERYRAELEELSEYDPEAYLDSLEPIGWKLGLERMHRLMTLLGMPQHRFASIHVVGTNGKSSVTQMIAALLGAHGLRAGACVSPHAARWSERILIGAEQIGAKEFSAAVGRVAAAAAVVNRSLSEGAVTQFEAATAAGFLALAAAKVQVGVIEAGLGGRLDATNTIPSRLTVLTSIGLDHTEWLGETEAEIAAEKLAVLRDHSTLVVGRLSPQIDSLAAALAAERGALMVRAGEDPGQRLRLRTLGRYQRRNFALALAAAKAFLGGLRCERVVEVASTLLIPGRLELIATRPPTLIDAAHNPDGAAALAEALAPIAAGRPVIACLAILADKDAAGIVAALAPALDRVICSELPGAALRAQGRPGAASHPAVELAAACARAGLPARSEPDLGEALRRSHELAAGPGGGVLVVAGSHYLLAPARAALGSATGR